MIQHKGTSEAAIGVTQLAQVASETVQEKGIAKTSQISHTQLAEVANETTQDKGIFQVANKMTQLADVANELIDTEQGDH